MNQLKLFKKSNQILWQIVPWKLISATAFRFLQPSTYPTNDENCHKSLPTTRAHCPTFVELGELLLLHQALYNYNETQDSPYDPTKFVNCFILRPKAVLASNCCQKFKKTVPFDDNVPFIDEENTLTSVAFDCGKSFYPEAPTDVGHINRERENVSKSYERCKCIPSNDQHSCSFDEHHNSKIILNE